MSTCAWWAALFFGGVLLPCRVVAAAELSGADAGEPAQSRASPCAPLTKRQAYGWQTLATDGAGVGLIIVGGALQFEGPVAITATSVGVGSLFLGGPMVHVAHGRWPIGVLDFGMRLTLPIVGAYVGSQYCPGECWGPVLAGFMIGVAPIWIDAGLLAWEDVPVEPALRDGGLFLPRSLARLGVTEIHPTAVPTRRGLALGLGGSF
jgi:hypothetical protein